MWNLAEICSVAVALSGCVSQIRSVDPNWDHASNPRCTDTYGMVVGDGVLTAVTVGGGLITADQIGDRQIAASVAIGGSVIGLGFAIAAYVGYDEVGDCNTAKEEWRVAAATARQEARQQARQQKKALPRGWFCATSTTASSVGLCARDRSICEQARTAAIAGIPDLGNCILVETAWCFAGDRCAPTPESCSKQREQLEASDECEERR